MKGFLHVYWNGKKTISTTSKILPNLTCIAKLPENFVNTLFKSQTTARTFVSKAYGQFFSWHVIEKRPPLSEAYCHYRKTTLKFVLNPMFWTKNLDDILESRCAADIHTDIWLDF